MSYTVDLTFNNHTNDVEDIIQLSSGKIASCGRSEVLIWDPDTSNVETTIGNLTNSFAISELSNGNIIIAEFDTVRIYDPSNGNQLNSYNIHNDLIQRVYELQDGRILTCSDDNTSKIYDLSTNTVDTTFTNHTFAVFNGDELPNGNIITTGADTAKIWDPDTGNEITSFNNHSGSVTAVEVIDDTTVATGDGNAEVLVWDKDSKNVQVTYNGNNFSVEDLHKLTDDKMVAGDRDNKLTVFDYTNGNRTENVTRPNDKVNSNYQLSDGRVVSAYENNVVEIYNFGLSGIKTLTGIDTTLADNTLDVGETTTVTVTANFSDGSSSDVTNDATITSNDTNIATVSGDTVTAQGFGSTTIKAEYNGETDTAPLDVKNATLNINYAKNVSATSAGFNGDLNTSGGITDADLGFVARRTSDGVTGDVFYSETQLDPNNLSLPFNYEGSLSLSNNTEYEVNAILRDADANTFESDDSLIINTAEDVTLTTQEPEDVDDDGAIFKGTVESVNNANITDLELYFEVREVGTTNFVEQRLVETIQISNITLPYEVEERFDSLNSNEAYEYRFAADSI